MKTRSHFPSSSCCLPLLLYSVPHLFCVLFVYPVSIAICPLGHQTFPFESHSESIYVRFQSSACSSEIPDPGNLKESGRCGSYFRIGKTKMDGFTCNMVSRQGGFTSFLVSLCGVYHTLTKQAFRWASQCHGYICRNSYKGLKNKKYIRPSVEFSLKPTGGVFEYLFQK